jgi:hypothetical protein
LAGVPLIVSRATSDPGETRFAPAVRSRPGEGSLRGLRYLTGHSNQAVRRRTLTYEAVKRVPGRDQTPKGRFPDEQLIFRKAETGT